MIRYLLCLLLLGASAEASSDAPPPVDRIEQILEEERLVGAAWVLVSGDESPQVGTAGFRDGPSKIPFTPETRFHVGSVTKLVLATGVLRLATEGRIDLDAPAADLLNGIEFDNPWQPTSPVTIRHLLDHTAGLEDARLWQMFSERPAPDTPLIEAFPITEPGLPIRTEPGTRFSYSNAGYGLLGLIIERVANQRYEAWLDESLLAPLNMLDSTFEFTAQTSDSSLAWGHVDDGSRYGAAPIFLRPAGQFTTTAADLGRLAVFLMSDGSIDGASFIAPELMEARGRPSGTEAARAGLVAGYALGMARRDRYGVVGYCHLGNIVGFVAELCIYPDERKAFAFSVNTDSETANYTQMAQALVDALALDPLPDVTTDRTAADLHDWAGIYAPSPNRFQTFEYLDALFGLKTLTPAPDGFDLGGVQGADRELFAQGSYLLRASDRSTTSHALLRGANGEYLFSDGFQTLERVALGKVALQWGSLLLGLVGLAWVTAAGLFAMIPAWRGAWARALAPAWAGLLLLLVPVPFLVGQSLLALGDATPGSMALATVTFLLPLSFLWALFRLMNGPDRGNWRWLHVLAVAAFLQWSAVLAWHGLLPLRLWT